MAITRTAKGTASSKISSQNDLSINGVSLDKGATLQVAVAWLDSNPGESPIVKYGGNTIAEMPNTRITQGNAILARFEGRIRLAGAKNITATWPSNLDARVLFATQFTEASTPDGIDTNAQINATAADTTSAGNTTVADTIQLGAFAFIGTGNELVPALAVGDGHTLGQTIGTNGGAATSNISIIETFEILAATGDVKSSVTLNTARDVISSIVAFKLFDTFEIRSADHLPWNVYQGSNTVEFSLEDGANVEVMRIRIPTTVFEIMSDAEVTDYLTSQCLWYAARADETNPREDTDSDIETRLATFVNDTIPV